MFTVTTPAADASLLTIAELRKAAGVADGSKDTELTELGKQVSALVAKKCGARWDGIVEPTLRQETLTEVFIASPRRGPLILGRRPLASVTSIHEGDIELDAEQFEIDRPAGILYRRDGIYRRRWLNYEITVVYVAGWATVPSDLRAAAMRMVKTLWSDDASSGESPNLKRVRVDGISEREYWVPPASDTLFTSEVDELLGDYMNPDMAVG